MPDVSAATAVDLFAGPGGWSLACRDLGIDELGIEYDDAACATREAAGLRTLQADVSALDPADFSADGLIASPPCQAFSMAGNGHGRKALNVYAEWIGRMAAGEPIDRATLDAACDDERAHLVLEPLRWALALRPEWIALEQVPPVLPLWELIAEALRGLGYSAWAGVLEAERYGVPQTRERAFMLARREGPVQPPAPTHQRYVPGIPASGSDDLFGDGCEPWVSMAEALGWVDGGTRSRSVGAGGPVVVNTRGARKTPGGNEFTADGPSLALTEKTRSWNLRSGQSVAGEGRAERPVDDPAFTVTGRTDLCKWTEERPATNVNGDPRIAAPGWHDPKVSGSQYGPGTVRVTVQEAAILQTFPPDYPWQGNPEKPNSRSAQFLMVGNAIPVLLARRCLSAVAFPHGSAVPQDHG